MANFAEVSVSTHEVNDEYMPNALPLRKKFSSVSVEDDREDTTQDAKDGGMRVVKKVAKNVKGSKKLSYPKS